MSQLTSSNVAKAGELFAQFVEPMAKQTIKDAVREVLQEEGVTAESSSGASRRSNRSGDDRSSGARNRNDSTASQSSESGGGVSIATALVLLLAFGAVGYAVRKKGADQVKQKGMETVEKLEDETGVSQSASH